MHSWRHFFDFGLKVVQSDGVSIYIIFDDIAMHDFEKDRLKILKTCFEESVVFNKFSRT